MKKRLPFILVIIIVVFSVAFINYSLSNNKLQKSSYNDSNDNQTQSSTTENVEEEQQSEEEKEISNNNDISDAKQETSIKQENTVNNKNNSNNSNNSSTIKDNNPSNPPIENKQEVVIPKEDVTPQVDPEYERLKSLIKYKDDMECYNASLDVSLEYLDDENFQVITCSSYAYNGQLLGYRMAVHYWDGTVVYLDAID